VGFVASGFGVLGVRPLTRIWRGLLGVSIACSTVALATSARPDLMVGWLINAAAAVTLLSAIVDPPERLPPSATGHPRAPAVQVLGECLSFGLLGYFAVCAATRSLHSRWGTTDEELHAALPGDVPGRHPAFEGNHAITIDAPQDAVFPWLLQLGQDRGGFYSYDWLESLFGLRVKNAESIRPEWQHRAVGDLVRAAPADWLGGLFGSELGWRITQLEPDHALVLRGWGAFVLQPLDTQHTRLIVRSKTGDRNAPVWGSALSFATFELPHFIMERRMLLGIKERAERHSAEPLPSPGPDTAIAAP
jgi:hypothetical protein